MFTSVLRLFIMHQICGRPRDGRHAWHWERCSAWCLHSQLFLNSQFCEENVLGIYTNFKMLIVNMNEYHIKTNTHCEKSKNETIWNTACQFDNLYSTAIKGLIDMNVWVGDENKIFHWNAFHFHFKPKAFVKWELVWGL